MKSKLIQDVRPYPHPLSGIPSEELIALLYIRGVTVTQIFGKYYEYDEVGAAHSDQLFGSDEAGLHGKSLSLEDARLAGVLQDELPNQPKERQPF